MSVQYLKPFHNFCITIGNLPTSYVESLSYYEMILWFIKYLEDTIIPTINNNSEVVNELQNHVTDFETNILKLYKELKDYVNSYFKNLDVQEEINNKLDNMAQSGMLEDLLNRTRTMTSQFQNSIYTKNINSQDFDVNLSEMNTDDFYDLWDALETEFPDKIKGYLWGYDDFDNALKYYVITANSKKDCGLNANEQYQTDILEDNLHSSPYMFFTSGIHGNEKNAIYELYLAFKDYLQGNKSSSNFILDNYNFIILPCCNPSGIDDNTRNNRNGVNINRNFPTSNWEAQEDIDKGEEPADQKETQFIIDVLESYNEQRFKTGMVCIDWHTHKYTTHSDKRVLWVTANNFRFKQFLLKQCEALKNMILNEFPELATDPNNDEHFIHFVTAVTTANCHYYCHTKGYTSATMEMPDNFEQGVTYSTKSHKIAYLIIANTILQLTSFSGNMPLTKYNQLAQIGCKTSNTLVEVIEALPNNSTLSVVLSSASTLMSDMPIYKGNSVHGLLEITKSSKYESDVTSLTYSSYGYKIPKRWIASYNNNDHFYGWIQIAKSVYGNRLDILELQDNTDPTIEEICEAMDDGTISVIRVSDENSNLYEQCNNTLGILTIKKPRYTNVDCEIEFISVNTDFTKMYNVYYRGTLRGWKVVTLTSLT